MIAPAEDVDLALVTCSACGFRLLVDPEHRDALLLHHADGAHRAIARDGALDGLETVTTASGLRVDVLALAVQVDDVRTSLARVLERLVELSR